MSFRQIRRSIWDNPGNRGERWWRALRAVAWQLQKHTVRRKWGLTLASGARFCAHPDCVVSSALVYSQWPEFHELMFIRGQLRREHAVIDVGANVGHFSLLLADKVTPANIFAFEPTPVTFGRLRENWERNRWPVARLFPLAVGDMVGQVQFPDSTRPETTNSVGQARAHTRLVQVPLVTLDSLRAQWAELPVGLLKIDVEGYEAAVLQGAEEVLHRDRPQLIMFESLGGQVQPAIHAILERAEYRVFQLDPAGQPDFGNQTGQNLFAVRRDAGTAIQADPRAGYSP